MLMNGYICNKCSATVHRGKQPFCLTQCGHIYCQECIQPAEKQCPQCQTADSFSVELQEPSLSRVRNFFAPIKEELETLNTVFGFQYNQMKIIIQRFLEVDKKYESLKAHYYNLSQSVKYFKDKYNKAKMENIELRKKLMHMEIHNRSMNSMSDTSTPMSSIHRKFKPRHTANTYVSTSGTNLSSTCKMFEGFRIPNSRSVKSHQPHDTSDNNSTYTFRQ